MLADFRLAIRTLVRTPAFALTTIGVLALGIGANTAIFSLVNQLLLNPQGVRDPDRLVAVRARYDKLNMPNISVSAPDFRDVENGRSVFDCAAVVRPGDYNYTAGDVPERLQGADISVRWFDVFRATPHLGRTFRPEEDQPNANNVVVLAHAAWMRVFGGDPSVVGRTISLNQKPYKIVGVMKADFRWPQTADLWVPLGLPAQRFTEDYRFNENLLAVARMKPGVSFAQANTFVHLAADRLKNSGTENAGYAKDARWGMFALPWVDFVATDTKKPMLVLMGAVVFVLLIACSNVAGLMVARTAGRAQEIAIRGALGASRWQLLRQTLAESSVLAAAGAVVGVVLAFGGMQVLLRIAPEEATVGLSARLQWPVLMFALLTTVVCSLLSAAAPAWQAAHVAPYEQIKSGGRSAAAAGKSRHRVRAVLVVSQTALALVLLVGAGLLLRSLVRLQDVSPGFDPRDVMTGTMSLPRANYADAPKQIAFYRAVVDRLAQAPGVRSAALGLPLPFSGDGSMASFAVEGRAAAPGDPGPHGNIRLVTPAYFRTLGIPLKQGRVFSDDDRADTMPVAVIDENLARQYWPNTNPIGRRIRNGGNDTPWATIVGVVGHLKEYDLAADDGKGTYYYSLFQQPERLASIVVKTRGGTSTQAAGIREAVRAVDPAQPVHTLKSLADLVSASLAPRRFVMQLLAFFAGVALFMAALGLYGVISYSVTQRTPEIGIRLALGARRWEVLRLVLGQGLRLAGVGIALGIAGAVAGGRVLASQLYETSRFDGLTFGAMAIVLLVTALAASYVPARRATRVDPLKALRTE